MHGTFEALLAALIEEARSMGALPPHMWRAGARAMLPSFAAVRRAGEADADALILASLDGATTEGADFVAVVLVEALHLRASAAAGERLVALAAGAAHPTLREAAAEAVLAIDEPESLGKLAQLASLQRPPAPGTDLRVDRQAHVALLRVDPDGAFERLSDALASGTSDREVAHQTGALLVALEARAQAGLSPPHGEPKWRTLLDSNRDRFARDELISSDPITRILALLDQPRRPELP